MFRFDSHSKFVMVLRWSVRVLLVAVCASALPACKKSPTTPTCVNGVGPGCPPPPAVALELTCPDIRIEEVKTPKQAVTFTATHTGGVEPVSNVCTPASGAEFELGTTAVTCNATDASVPAKTATCSFNVTLVPFVPPVPDLSVTQFMAFGDSITADEIGDPKQGDWLCPDFPGPESAGVLFTPQFMDSSLTYPAVVDGLLRQRYTRQTFSMANEGMRRLTAKDGTLLLPGFLATHRPEVLLLLHGILDVHSTGDPDAPIEALETDVQLAKAAGVKAVLLSTLLPVAGGSQICGDLTNDQVRAANDKIRPIANQDGVYLVDSYAAFVGRMDTLMGEDGLHPTAEGQKVMAETFFDVIKKNLELPLTSSTAGSSLSRPQKQVRPPAHRQSIRIPKGQQ